MRRLSNYADHAVLGGAKTLPQSIPNVFFVDINAYRAFTAKTKHQNKDPGYGQGPAKRANLGGNQGAALGGGGGLGGGQEFSAESYKLVPLSELGAEEKLVGKLSSAHLWHAL